MDLEKALEQFDIVEANVRRLQKIWDEIRQLVPGDPEFTDNTSPGDQRYRELPRAYQAIIKALPPIGARSIETAPWELNDIGRARLDARLWGEGLAEVPGKARWSDMRRHVNIGHAPRCPGHRVAAALRTILHQRQPGRACRSSARSS